MGMVEDAEQRPLQASVEDRLRELQVGDGRAVERHVVAELVRMQHDQLVHAVLLGMLQIAEQDAGCDHGVALSFEVKIGELFRAELLQHRLAGGGQRVLLFRQLCQINIRHRFRPLRVIVKIPLLVEEDLFGADAHDLVVQRLVARKTGELCGVDLSGRYIAVTEPCPPAVDIAGGKVVVFIFFQHGAVGNGARCDDLDDFPLHETFGGLRVFRLFADRYFVALFHEARDIRVCAVERHAAHGRPLLQSAGFAGQCQFKFF